MKHTTGISTAILLLVTLWPGVGSAAPGQEANNSKKNESPKGEQKKSGSTANVRVQVSAEGKESLPSGATIQWKGLDVSCAETRGSKNLVSSGTTPLSLPVCRVKILIIVTGFDTKPVTLDLGGKEEKYGDPIRIMVKQQGPPEVDW